MGTTGSTDSSQIFYLTMFDTRKPTDVATDLDFTSHYFNITNIGVEAQSSATTHSLRASVSSTASLAAVPSSPYSSSSSASSSSSSIFATSSSPTESVMSSIPSSESTSTTAPSHSLSLGEKAGIGAGIGLGIPLLIILTIIAVLLGKRRHARTEVSQGVSPDQQEQGISKLFGSMFSGHVAASLVPHKTSSPHVVHELEGRDRAVEMGSLSG
ncbi:hypothetical protein LTS18_008503 [Coniosporium uncinatum]|uniref:Uncharacterized protein n=1 Tax=Coniosporium uncinatum TaxID=93489 RepID=A0ACC3D1Y5_9PEZI|nr:hypothetical protein LTS18_008503 [Coniosporium uncinatum]